MPVDGAWFAADPVRQGRITRRRLLATGVAGTLALVAAACGSDRDSSTTSRTPADATPTAAGTVSSQQSPGGDASTTSAPNPTSIAAGKLTARPATGAPATAFTTRLQSVGIGREEDAILYVPRSYTPENPAPLFVMFHGAGGDARGIISLFPEVADTTGMVVLAIRSQAVTWDVISARRFGADIERLDLALGVVFARYAIDPNRIALAGFSDGASYALSVGLTNGGLVTEIIAFAPGFVAPGRAEGEPRIFIAHGTLDVVLPIDQTSRVIAPQLTDAGYEVEYVEFDGTHSLPPDIVDRAMAWWLGAA